MVDKGTVGRGGMDWKFGVSRCKLVLIYIEWINNKVLIYSTGNYIQYPMINHNGKELKKKNVYVYIYIISSVQFHRSVVSDSLRPHEPQHTRPPCPSLTPGVHPNPWPSSRRCHPTISSSVVPFSSCPQSLPASGSDSQFKSINYIHIHI